MDALVREYISKLVIELGSLNEEAASDKKSVLKQLRKALRSDQTKPAVLTSLVEADGLVMAHAPEERLMDLHGSKLEVARKLFPGVQFQDISKTMNEAERRGALANVVAEVQSAISERVMEDQNFDETEYMESPFFKNSLDHFYNELRTLARYCDEKDSDTLLNMLGPNSGSKSWVKGRRAELFALNSIKPEYLQQVFDLKILEMGKFLPEPEREFFKKKAETEDQESKRFYLVRLAFKNQSFILAKWLKRQMAVQLAERVNSVVSFVLLLVLCPLLIVGLATDDLDLDLLLISVIGGAFGAGFSMISNVNRRVSTSSYMDLFVQANWKHIRTRIWIGACSGLILFVLLMSGAIAGTMLPDLSQEAGGKKYALVLLWAIISGFMERLIPSYLDVVAKGGKKTETKQ